MAHRSLAAARPSLDGGGVFILQQFRNILERDRPGSGDRAPWTRAPPSGSGARALVFALRPRVVTPSPTPGFDRDAASRAGEPCRARGEWRASRKTCRQVPSGDARPFRSGPGGAVRPADRQGAVAGTAAPPRRPPRGARSASRRASRRPGRDAVAPPSGARRGIVCRSGPPAPGARARSGVDVGRQAQAACALLEGRCPSRLWVVRGSPVAWPVTAGALARARRQGHGAGTRARQAPLPPRRRRARGSHPTNRRCRRSFTTSCPGAFASGLACWCAIPREPTRSWPRSRRSPAFAASARAPSPARCWCSSARLATSSG